MNVVHHIHAWNGLRCDICKEPFNSQPELGRFYNRNTQHFYHITLHNVSSYVWHTFPLVGLRLCRKSYSNIPFYVLNTKQGFNCWPSNTKSIFPRWKCCPWTEMLQMAGEQIVIISSAWIEHCEWLLSMLVILRRFWSCSWLTSYAPDFHWGEFQYTRWLCIKNTWNS